MTQTNPAFCFQGVLAVSFTLCLWVQYRWTAFSPHVGWFQVSTIHFGCKPCDPFLDTITDKLKGRERQRDREEIENECTWYNFCSTICPKRHIIPYRSYSKILSVLKMIMTRSQERGHCGGRAQDWGGWGAGGTGRWGNPNGSTSIDHPI